MNDISSTSFDHHALAGSLFELRSAGRSQAAEKFVAPQDITTAMRAQTALAELEGVSGNTWKVAMSPDKHAIVAPLHPYVETARNAEMPYLPGMKFEVEIALRLGRDLPVRDEAYSREEIFDAVSSAHLGAELLFTAVEHGASVTFMLHLSDRLANGGYVLGPVVPKALIDTIDSADLKVIQGDVSIYEGPAKHPIGDVLGWLVAYANDKMRPANVLVSGALITTGALPGALALPGPGLVEVLLANEHVIEVALEA